MIPTNFWEKNRLSILKCLACSFLGKLQLEKSNKLKQLLTDKFGTRTLMQIHDASKISKGNCAGNIECYDMLRFYEGYITLNKAYMRNGN